MHFSSKSLAAIIALASCCHHISGATNNFSSRRRISESSGYRLFQESAAVQQAMSYSSKSTEDYGAALQEGDEECCK